MLFPGCVERTVPTAEADIHLAVGGQGPPLLLLHGYPQTHVMWHRVAGDLARNFTVIAADLRGYGDSAKPATTPDHFSYSKRASARDMANVMTKLGFETFFIAGHDRGGRVGHRLALDFPERVSKLAVLDIVPTAKVFGSVNQAIATGYYHWFFLIQPSDFPERLIGADPAYYLRWTLARWSGSGLDCFEPKALAAYLRWFEDPAAIHASCEDYRAGASIDLAHDAADRGKMIACPVLALWGKKGLIHRHFDVLEAWRELASNVQGLALDCGHFLPEEAPAETARALSAFFRAGL
jgi:haloacetate dehalogenase